MKWFWILAAAFCAHAADFATDVWPVMAKANCAGCHRAAGPAGATRMRIPSGTSATELAALGESLAAVVNAGAPEQSLLLRKPTNREPHGGGAVIAPGSAGEAALLGWARHLASRTTTATAKPAVRRLTHSQYNRTVRDLLGDQTRPADRFPPEDYVNGFKNQSSAQDISPLLAQAYAAAAERLARAAFAGGRDDRKLLPCAPSSPRDAACAAAFVRHFGERAFRRPLTASEVERYAAVFGRTQNFLQGAAMVIEAMLQSPKFLFRIEDGSPYDQASRLSYFLWDTMPDEALRRAAAQGKIDIEATARRMLTAPQAREAVDEFTAQWLRFDLLLNAVKDRRLFPQYTEELGVAMTEETRRTIADAAWGAGNFLAVFTTGYGFVNADLASLYKLPPAGEEFTRTAYPPESGRAGILSQAMFLALTSKPGETSPTVRGAFIREHFLCQTVPDPPPGTNASLPPLSPDRPLTTRQRMGEHVANPLCANCHRLMDPIGFGLEGFDAIGQMRATEAVHFFPTRETRMEKAKVVQLPLDTEGAVTGFAQPAFTGPKALGQLLATNADCQECIVRQLFRYAMGRKETAADEAVLRDAFTRFRDSQFRFTELMIFLAVKTADLDRSQQ